MIESHSTNFVSFIAKTSRVNAVSHKVDLESEKEWSLQNAGNKVCFLRWLIELIAIKTFVQLVIAADFLITERNRFHIWMKIPIDFMLIYRNKMSITLDWLSSWRNWKESSKRVIASSFCDIRTLNIYRSEYISVRWSSKYYWDIV